MQEYFMNSGGTDAPNEKHRRSLRIMIVLPEINLWNNIDLYTGRFLSTFKYFKEHFYGQFKVKKFK